MSQTDSEHDSSSDEDENEMTYQPGAMQNFQTVPIDQPSDDDMLSDRHEEDDDALMAQS